MLGADVAQTSQLTDSNAVVWQHPTRNLQIAFQKEPLVSICGHVLAGLNGKPRTEIGGVLLGYTVDSPEMTSVVITEAIIVPGRSKRFNASSEDEQRLEAIIDSLRRENRGPVGVFKSRAREERSLSELDGALMERCFLDPRSVFLVNYPSRAGALSGGFFLWEDGRFETRFTKFRVPVFAPEGQVPAKQQRAEREPTEREPTEREPTEREPTEREPAGPLLLKRREEPATGLAAQSGAKLHRYLEDAPATHQGRIDQRRLVMPGLVALAAAAVLAVAIGFGVYLGGRQFRAAPVAPSASAIPPQAGFALQVNQHPGGLLELAWDPQIVTLAGAQSAALQIMDGANRRTVPLDVDQLRQGRMDYFATSSTLTFQLTINQDEQRSITESVRVFLPSALAGVGAHVPTSAATFKEPTATDMAQPVKQTQIPPLNRVSLQPRTKLGNSFESAPVLSSVTPTATMPDISTSMPPPPAPQQRRAQTSVPLGSFIEPRVLHKYMPDLSSIPRMARAERSQVHVVLTIDSSGKVVEARSLDDQGALGSACVAAARQWQFEPAKLGGRTVGSAYTIAFQFRPSSPD